MKTLALNEVFDITPSEVVYEEQKHLPSVPTEVHNVVEDDINFTRGNLYLLLQQGEDALIAALEVAKQSEHPRAFEVVGNLMKQLSDINHQLLDIHRKKQQLQEPEKKETNITNNSIFVGSTNELSKMIANMKKGE
jgi:hypothetical protein